MKAQTVIDTILGEAAYGTRAERFDDMLGIASVIANRSVALDATPQSVVSAPGQFSAYGQSLPAGVEAYRSLAEDAYNTIQTIGPITSATFYATPAATGNLPGGLKEVGRTTGHVYHEDPKGRAIATAEGFKTPDLGKLATIQVNVPTPAPAPRSEQTVAAPAQPSRGPGLAALAPNGLLGTTGKVSAPIGPGMGPDTPAARGSIGFYNPGQQTIAPQMQTALEVAAGKVGDLGITSGFRSAAHNRSVGGSPGSLHTKGLAVDIDMKGMGPEQRQGLVQTLTELGFKGFSTYSRSPNMMHADMRDLGKHNPFGNPHFMHDRSSTNLGKAPGWFQEMAEFGGTKTPATAPVPMSREEATNPTSGFQQAATSLANQGFANVGGKVASTGVPGTQAQIAPAGIQASALAPAPVEAVSRGGLAPATAPTGTSMKDAYGQMAATMGMAGVRGLGAMPTAAPIATPSTPTATGIPTFAPTMTAPTMNPAVAPRSVQTTQVTPARAPAPAPARSGPAIAPTQTRGTTISAPAQQPTQSMAATGPLSALRSGAGTGNLATRGAYAAAGAMIGGLPGALIGGLFGPSLARGLGGLLGTGYPALGPTGIGYTAGLGFPAPPPGGVLGGGIPTNNSYDAMASYSPNAADAISAGRGGLY